MPARQVLPLPITVEEITPDWLTAALFSTAPDAAVSGMQVLSVINSTTTVIRMKLDFNEAGRRSGVPAQLILKGGFEPHSRHLAQLHKLEVEGYRDVLSALELPSPTCYFARYCEEQLQGIVIMEDLSLRQVDFCSALRPQTFSQVAGRLSTLAKFHAKTWDSPELANGKWSWLRCGLPDLRDHWKRDYLRPDVWPKFVSAPRGAAGSVLFHDLRWAQDTLDKLARFSNTLPHAVLHGDAHLGNTYIDEHGTHGFYDPMVHRDHVIRDVGYHLAGALDTADRRRWEGPLLQHYLDELGRSGVEPPGFDEMWHIYGAYLALGYLIWVVNDAIFQTESVNTANAARFSAAMLDHDTLGILRTLE